MVSSLLVATHQERLLTFPGSEWPTQGSTRKPRCTQDRYWSRSDRGPHNNKLRTGQATQPPTALHACCTARHWAQGRTALQRGGGLGFTALPCWPAHPPAEWAGLVLVQLDGLLGPLEAANTAGLLHLQPRAQLPGVLSPGCAARLCHATAAVAGRCIIATNPLPAWQSDMRFSAAHNTSTLPHQTGLCLGVSCKEGDVVKCHRQEPASLISQDRTYMSPMSN